MRIPDDEEITVTVTAADGFELTWTGHSDTVTDALYRTIGEWDERRSWLIVAAALDAAGGMENGHEEKDGIRRKTG